MKNKKMVYVQDEDSHWYWIPSSMKIEFETDCEKAYSSDDFDEFNKKFENYRIGCHPSNHQK